MKNKTIQISADELHEICMLTLSLTEIRQRGCGHLCIENIAPEIFLKLLSALVLIKEGKINNDFC